MPEQFRQNVWERKTQTSLLLEALQVITYAVTFEHHCSGTPSGSASQQGSALGFLSSPQGLLTGAHSVSVAVFMMAYALSQTPISFLNYP
jgi:hypothetical protein